MKDEYNTSEILSPTLVTSQNMIQHVPMLIDVRESGQNSPPSKSLC